MSFHPNGSDTPASLRSCASSEFTGLGAREEDVRGKQGGWKAELDCGAPLPESPAAYAFKRIACADRRLERRYHGIGIVDAGLDEEATELAKVRLPKQARETRSRDSAAVQPPPAESRRKRRCEGKPPPRPKQVMQPLQLGQQVGCRKAFTNQSVVKGDAVEGSGRPGMSADRAADGARRRPPFGVCDTKCFETFVVTPHNVHFGEMRHEGACQLRRLRVTRIERLAVRIEVEEPEPRRWRPQHTPAALREGSNRSRVRRSEGKRACRIRVIQR